MVDVLPFPIFLNSSWVWLTSTRPMELLPVVIVATLVIEIGMIVLLNRIKGKKRIAISGFAVIVANAVSFLVPYVSLVACNNELGMARYDFFIKMTDHWPTYTVGIFYLVLTLLLEVPIIYMMLKKHVAHRKKLLLIIVSANVLTTVMVAIVERVVCVGTW